MCSCRWSGQWSVNIVYCREIVMVNPFQSKKGSLERGALWTQIASNLNALVSPKFIVMQRSVRDHLVVLQKRYQKKMGKEERESGTSPEKTELDILIEEIFEAEEIGEAEQEEASIMRQEINDQEKAKADDIRLTADDIRLTAMETFSETQKRKGEEKKKTQRKQRSGGDMVQYLKERFENEREMRKEEMEIKQKKLELEEKKYNTNWQMQHDSTKQQMELLKSMQEQNTSQQKHQQQQFQQHMQQMANFQMALMQSQQEQQQAMLEFFNKIVNKN